MPLLKSSAIVRADWTVSDDKAQIGTLDVEFPSGRTYSHEDVPQSVYEGLTGATSPGRYYNDNIKGAY